MKSPDTIRTATVRGAAVLGTLALTACLFGQEEDAKPVPAPFGVACVDVPDSVKTAADALVESGNRKMVDNFEFWFDRSDSWWDAKARSPQPALADFEQALALAPGHCQAVFGRAIANASLITQDEKMDAFVRKVEAMEEDGGLAKRSGRPATFASLFKATPDEAAPALAKLSSSLRKVDRPTLEDVQSLIETSIMPRLDSTISAMESVLDYRMFAVRFDVDGSTFEIDRGEVGPGLAGLKVAKAWLTMVAGYNLDVRLDGSYDWMETLGGIRNPDFDRLAPDQTKALRHFTGLFETGSPFTRMKPAWKEKIQGIPALLLTAVEDAQRGLESAIEEARTPGSQEYDIWRAGDGEDADIDTVDLKGAIEALERSKKYLRGEVPVSYDRGGKTITVDFTRLFHIDGAQKLLPRFKFLPFEQWNDTVAADTSWSEWFGREAQRQAAHALGYGAAWDFQDREYAEWYISVHQTTGFDTLPPGEVTYAVVLTAYGKMESTQLATFTADPVAPCRFSFQRAYRLQGAIGESTPAKVADVGRGEFTLSGCRVEDGQAEFVSWVDAVTKGPIVFLDASGKESLTIPQMEEIDGPLDLKGRITFEDPTFGGLFPGMTQDGVWQQVNDIGESPGDRVIRKCEEVEHPEGWWEYKCTTSLPSDPSDLDYLVYYLDWMDRVF